MPRTDQNKKTLYLDEAFGSKDSLLGAICQLAEKEGVGRMQISPHEARILQFLTRLSKAKKVVEMGTLYGYSALHIARALPPEGRIWTLDKSQKRHKKSQELLKDAPDFKKINWISRQALEGLKSIESFAPFDMVFIDADKESYLKYLAWAKKHLKKGGLLVADNTFLFGAVYGESCQNPRLKAIMREFNKQISNSWKGALIPTTEGLTVGIKQ